MKYLLVFILLLAPLDRFTKIANSNRAIKEADSAFNKEDYLTAMLRYEYLLDTLKINNAQAAMNLALCYTKSGDLSKALEWYDKVSTLTAKDETKSIAFQQMGVITAEFGQDEKAKDYLFIALQYNPANEDARFDYELLLKAGNRPDSQKRKQRGQKRNAIENPEGDQDVERQSKGNQNLPNNKNDKGRKANKGKGNDYEDDSHKNQNPDSGEPEHKNKDSQGNEKNKADNEKLQVNTQNLEAMGLSEERARLLLDQMRNSEIQYLQQQKHKVTNNSYKGKPEW